MIRYGRKEDVPALLDIYNYEVTHGVATYDLEEKTLEERMDWFHAHTGHHPLLVSEEDGIVAGYATLSTYRPKQAYASTVELSIYIHPDHRGKGVASALMEEILKLAKADDTIHAVVSVITSGNAASTRLHEKFGFTFCGTLKETGVKFGRYLSIDHYELFV